MKKQIEAFIREEGSLRELSISSAEKPAVDQAFIKRWQNICNIIAVGAHDPVAVLLRITQDSVRILFQSGHTDGGEVEYYLWNGLYCESELQKSGLLITNVAAKQSQSNPRPEAPAFTACFGLPIQWPDQELFGAICVLNKPGKFLSRAYQSILAELRVTFEQELNLLFHQHQLLQDSETDALTSIYNRRKIETVLRLEFDRAKRYAKYFSVTMFDLNSFKQINDTFGHDAGDEILRTFAQSIGSKIRETDYWGRWGGDEFMLICPHADATETQRLISRIKKSIDQKMQKMAAYSDFSFGVSQYEQTDQAYQAIVKRADENMYRCKNQYKRKIINIYDHQTAFAE